MIIHRLRIVTLLAAAVILLPGFASLFSAGASAQQGERAWEILAPEGEEFRVLMPKEPKEESEKQSYHRFTLNASLYKSSSPDGSTLILATLSGIKLNAAYSENERFNSYIDALGKWIPAKLPLKDSNVRLAFKKDITLKGQIGREYSLVASGMSGRVRCFVTRKKFYALAVLGPKVNDTVATRFFESFSLPEKPAEAEIRQPIPPPKPPAPVAAASPAATDNAVDTVAKPDEASNEPADPQKQKDVQARVLNGRAVSLPKPDFPPGAGDSTNGSGVVTVQVTIDEGGNVIQAQMIAGPEAFRQAAELAAMQAKFPPSRRPGRTTTGVITYNPAAP